MKDTIFALASGSLGCGVAVVRVSGPRVKSIAKRFCGSDVAARYAAYKSICDPRNGELIDTGLVLFFQAPASFTGEDCLEFQIHGSRAVVLRLFSALSAEDGCRMAEPGEFIRRAFENDKLRKQALLQAGGHLADQASEWRDDLLNALSLLEAEIDFADEGDAPLAVLPQVRKILVVLDGKLRHALEQAERGERIRSGYRIALAGRPNAGKSSLMNALVRRDVAIVSEYAGTTRDVIEVEFDLGGYSVVLADTAGLRDTADPVESVGVARTLQELSKADLVLWLEEATNEFCVPVGMEAEILKIASKMDIVTAMPGWADLGISVKSGSGIEELLSAMSRMAQKSLSGEPPLITNLRQKACISAAARHLQTAMSHQGEALELVAEDLRRVRTELEALMGRIGVEDILGTIFSRFCMGK
jgi:tRNA modification GTPase